VLLKSTSENKSQEVEESAVSSLTVYNVVSGSDVFRISREGVNFPTIFGDLF